MLTLKHGIVASSLNVINQLVRRMIGIVSLIILARVLTPEDFGLVAIALIFLNFVDVVTNIGGRAYLLSREEINEDDVQSNWTLQFTIKNTVGILLAISSVFIARFYDDPNLIPIILVFSIQIFVSTIGSPGLIFKEKKQELGAITRWQITSRFVTTGITIFIAIMFKTYWALIIGQFLVALSTCIASYVIAPMKPRFTFKNAKQQWEFSKWIVPQSLINFFRSQIDALFVSHIFEKAIMGAYNSMRYYANIPATIFIKPIIGTTLTQFSEFKNNHNYFSKQLQVAFYCLSAIASPIIYLMSTHDTVIVKIMLGDKWVQYSALLGTFSLLIILTTMNSILSQIAMLKDATKLLLYYSILCVLTHTAIFAFVDFENVYKLATYKILADVTLSVVLYIYIIWRLLSFNAIFTIGQPILFSIMSIIVVDFLVSNISHLENEIFDFLYKCIIFSCLYVLSLIFVMLTLRSRIYCFDYILTKITPIFRKCFKY